MVFAARAAEYIRRQPYLLSGTSLCRVRWRTLNIFSPTGLQARGSKVGIMLGFKWCSVIAAAASCTGNNDA